MTDTAIDEMLARSRSRRRLPAPPVLRLIRERAQLSQADVAEPVGVDRATVARWELGTRRPRGEQLVRYLDVLDWLIAEEAS